MPDEPRSLAADRPRRSRKRLRTLLVLLPLLALAGAGAWWKWGPRPPGDRSGLDLLYEAWRQFEAGRLDAATSMLDRRASAVRPTPLDWMLRARIAEAQRRYEDGLRDLGHIPDSDPSAPQAWLKAGQLELARNQARAAERAYRRSLELDPDQVRCRRELAYLYGLQRRWAAGDDQFRALDRLTTLDHVLLFAWCQNFCKLWDPGESGKRLRAFLDQDPNDRSSRLALATSLQMSNRRDEAEQVLAPLGDDADGLAIRIQIAIDRGEIDAAREMAAKGGAEHPGLNLMRATIALRSKDARAAATLYRAVLAAEPEDRDALHGLGLALQRLDDPQGKEYLAAAARHDELRRTIQDSVTTIKSDPKLFFKLATQCEALRRLPEARGWFRLAIGRDPLDEQAQAGLARVERAIADPTAR